MYASGDKLPTQMGTGVGIYKCFCNQFSDLMDLVKDIDILKEDKDLRKEVTEEYLEQKYMERENMLADKTLHEFCHPFQMA